MSPHINQPFTRSLLVVVITEDRYAFGTPSSRGGAQSAGGQASCREPPPPGRATGHPRGVNDRARGAGITAKL
jgi:hypothetical protein